MSACLKMTFFATLVALGSLAPAPSTAAPRIDGTLASKTVQSAEPVFYRCGYYRCHRYGYYRPYRRYGYYRPYYRPYYAPYYDRPRLGLGLGIF